MTHTISIDGIGEDILMQDILVLEDRHTVLDTQLLQILGECIGREAASPAEEVIVIHIVVDSGVEFLDQGVDFTGFHNVVPLFFLYKDTTII
jgi:hypothetical protein